jgi:hypothetical protein
MEAQHSSDTDLVAQLNKELKLRWFAPVNDYESIAVFVTYWEISDNPNFRTEAIEVENFFTTTFKYTVKVFPIPNEQPDLVLESDLMTLLVQLTKSPNSLLIIYYGGHGDPNDDSGQPRESVWAA